MVCPKCKGKTLVIDTVKDIDYNEIYRKRRCQNCDYTFFTTEFEVRKTPQFREDWAKHHRHWG